MKKEELTAEQRYYGRETKTTGGTMTTKEQKIINHLKEGCKIELYEERENILAVLTDSENKLILNIPLESIDKLYNEGLLIESTWLCAIGKSLTTFHIKEK